MNYYRKPINKVANDVKFKIQLGALTLKISENNNKIDDLLEVDKNIKNDVPIIQQKLTQMNQLLMMLFLPKALLMDLFLLICLL